jgi:hypothetical protein
MSCRRGNIPSFIRETTNQACGLLSLIKLGLFPLLQLIVPWFVVSYNAWFVASRATHGAVVCCLSYNAWFVASLVAHGTVVGCLLYCKRGNKPSFIRDNKPQHHELQERQQTQLYKRPAHGAVVGCLSCSSWCCGLLSLIMPGLLPLLKFIVLWFVFSLIKPGLLPLLLSKPGFIRDNKPRHCEQER